MYIVNGFCERYISLWTKFHFPDSTDPRPAEVAASLENQRIGQFNETLRQYFKLIQDSY